MGGNSKYRSRFVYYTDEKGRKRVLRDENGKPVKVGVREYTKREKRILQAAMRGGTPSKMPGRRERNTGTYRENYPQERMDKALYAKDKETFNDRFFAITGKWWQDLNNDEKQAAYDFTGNGYGDINKTLGGRIPAVDISDKVVGQINNLTSALEKSEITEDIWVRRGVSSSHIGRMVGVTDTFEAGDKELVLQKMEEAIKNEKIIHVDNFMSTTPVENTGFSDTFEMKIFVPKGSKGVYAEPFAAFGGGAFGDRGLWDGVSELTSFGREFEVLLQRGYNLKPMQINRGAGHEGSDQIVFAIVGQDTQPYVKPEIDWSKI